VNFAELRFWELLLVALTIILGLRALLRNPPACFDKGALLALGLFLLCCVSGVTFAIFLLVAVFSYLGLKWILYFHGRAPRRYLFLLIPLQLLPLLFYKYGDFFLHTVLHLHLSVPRTWLHGVSGLDYPALRNLVIPVGISFYTFQKVAFVVDTIAFKQPLPRFLDYMNFAGFFPQIVAGPIERRKDLLPQMENFRFAWNSESIDEGTRWIVLGLFFKCVLADNLAAQSNEASVFNAYQIWMANLFFGLRIYYDFAGYSIVALGLARCLGIRLTLNFASPYLSTSAAEFWRRWHITLSQWFRDYLYIPLGGGRVPWWAANIALVFVVSGLWHGAGWGFILWGAMHGAFLILNRLVAGRVPVPAFLGWLLTNTAAFFAWLCFYETRPAVLFRKLHSLITPASYQLHLARHVFDGYLNKPTLSLLICGVAFALEWASLRYKNEPYHYFRGRAVSLFLILAIVFLSPESNAGFIYFAF